MVKGCGTFKALSVDPFLTKSKVSRNHLWPEYGTIKSVIRTSDVPMTICGNDPAAYNVDSPKVGPREET